MEVLDQVTSEGGKMCTGFRLEGSSTQGLQWGKDSGKKGLEFRTDRKEIPTRGTF